MSETMVTWAILLAIPGIFASWQMAFRERRFLNSSDWLVGIVAVLAFTGMWVGFFWVVIWMIHSAHWRF